ncbi:MAG: transglutaminase-like domain-containing protein [Wenzhouxiangella sp.]|jgi:transglutaminase-like putative cysteine protease|nr:transglutaminase-like domain-containing protein [Wenzhouxiangella sp.]
MGSESDIAVENEVGEQPDWELQIAEFVSSSLTGQEGSDQVGRAVALYYAVRDGFKYDPFDIRIDFADQHPGEILAKGKGHCIDKALFLVSCLRTIDIPARLGLAKVRNHIGTARLEQLLRTDVLVPHGYTDVFLEGRWFKCTPAFNKELCEKLKVHPLEWDGRSDSMFQEDNRDGGRFMEYLEDYGSFEQVPEAFIVSLFKREYPHQFDAEGKFLPLAV